MLDECLDGVRVLDLSQYIPGPFATRMLADLGAEVLKIEPPGGDPMRRFMAGADDISPLYLEINAGKCVSVVDLKTQEGRAIFAELAAAADVLLESFRPGVLDRLGFGGERLCEINPRLIHCALSGFGRTGPWRQRAGHDLTYMALTGGLNATGTKAAPVMTFPPVADHAGAMQAVIAILGALLRRARTGQSVFLDVGLFEAALSWQGMGLTLAQEGGDQSQRGRGLLTGGAACYQIYRTRDQRFVALAALEEKFWRGFCEAVGRSGWIARQQEPLPQSGLISEVSDLFASLSFAECRELAANVDCCLEPVLTYAEVPDHPQVRARGLVRRLGGAPGSEVLFPAWLDGRPPADGRRPLRPLSPESAVATWQVAGGTNSHTEDR